jgi:conjugative transfer signal peptidase TraF
MQKTLTLAQAEKLAVRQRIIGNILLVIGMGGLALLFFLPHWFTVNRTPSSAPRGIYLRTHRPFKRGDLVEVCLPHNWARFAVSRAYIRASGRCSDNTEPIIKEIAGMPGDEVYVDPASILATDSGGRSMPRSYPGRHLIQAGQIWLGGNAPNCFDSRYFSSVPMDNVQAVLRPIWTW